MLSDSLPRRENILLSRLRPTQLTVGRLEVKHKRKRLRALEKRPAELVDFILEMPIRVVLGPVGKAYVIDHHHLALALLKEDFQTAPMESQARNWRRTLVPSALPLCNLRGEKTPPRSRSRPGRQQ